jgi:hopene-associated glycosyltransferase HpnB
MSPAARRTPPGRPAIAIAVALTAAAALAWAYLLAGHGGFWRTSQRLPHPDADGPGWPSVTAVIPARDEAEVLPLTLPSLLSQDYPGRFALVLVDDESSDGTALVATSLGKSAGWTPPHADGAERHDRTLTVVYGQPLPPGWAGKVWAMSQGAAQAGQPDHPTAGQPDFLLFTDADIAFGPGAVTALVRAAGPRRALVSQMALLRTTSGWEKALVPAFVYFFAQLYPFRRVNRGGRTAAAAGGCMLVCASVLAQAGGMAAIREARIDDVALARLLKPRAPRGCWLGLSTDIVSVREYSRLSHVWDMVARSAYTQLRYSPAALAGTVAGLAWLYLLPPGAAIAGLAAAAAGGGTAAAWLAAAGVAGWAMMAVSYVPMLRLYQLSPWRAPSLPLIAALYAAMTADSARRHHAGRGGAWKGRTIGG